LILAGDTDGNLGDRAIVLSMCNDLRRVNPNVEIWMISGDPENDKGFFNVNTIRRGIRGLPALVSAAMDSDLILCGGGGLFQDDGSLVKMPYWAMRIALAKLLSHRVIGYSLGVGPLYHRLSRFFARFAFSCMERISVRDPEAEKTSKPLTTKPIQIIPDPALLLPAAPRNEALSLLQRLSVPYENPLVGVSVRRWFHQYPSLIPHKYAYKYKLRKIPGEHECDRMTSLLANVLDRIAEEHQAHIVFMPTYNVLHESDDLLCQEIQEKMDSGRSSLIRISDPRLYKAVTGFLSVMLGGRLHSAIISVGMGIQVVGLAYNQKFWGFFELLGIQDRVVSVEDFVKEEMTDQLITLLSDAVIGKSKPTSKVMELQALIRKFNDDILNKAYVYSAKNTQPKHVIS